MIDDGGLFPADWDASRDLIVVVGRGAEALFTDLVKNEQRRIFVYLPEEAVDPQLPRRVQVAHTPMDLMDGILGLRGALLKRAVVRRQTDPWVTDELHDEVARTVEEAVRAKRLQAATLDEHGPTWLLQGVAALPELARHASITALDGAFAKRPCFIVSPGPSLEGNVALLREVKGRAVIMTCTHALSALQAHDVVPDLVMAADSGPDLLRHYEGVDTSGVEALVVGATCVREHWRRPARRYLSFASNGELDDWAFEPVGENARLKTGGSVACSELSLALRMGCDPIVFVGQDLSFPDDKYYSESSVDGKARIKISEDGHSFQLVKPPGTPEAEGDHQVARTQQLVKVQGYNGGLVLTSGSFYSFLVWFEVMAKSLEGRTMLINSTEGGANLRGMQHKPLADVIAAYVRGPVPVGEVLDGRTTDRIDVARRQALIKADVERILTQLAPCLDLVTKCRVLAREARNDASRLERLQETEVELIGALRPLRFLSLIAPGEIAAAQGRIQDARTLEENLAAAEDLFQVVERACHTLRAPLEAARAELG